MKPVPSSNNQPPADGFSLVEVIFAVFFLSFFLGGTVFLLVENASSLLANSDHLTALNLAQEGIEASSSIRTDEWCNATTGVHGLAITAGQWSYAGTGDTIGKFTRTVQIDPVYRDSSGVIVNPPGGVLDYSTKQVTVTVTWLDSAGTQQQQQLFSYPTYWRAPRNGMLVYGDGGTTSDTIRYRVLNGSTNQWDAALQVPDVDTSTTNKALYAVSVYGSQRRDEKIIISKHFNGTAQSIYANVYAGCTGWGTPFAITSYNSTSFTDAIGFSGTYLDSGDFMLVYADNTTIPKFRVWDGTTWSAQISMQNLTLNGSNIPTFVVAEARPGTNEVMAAFFGQAKDTNTQYFNGGVYTTANWTLHARHANNAPVNSKKLVDFDWSRNTPTKGGLVFSNASTDRRMHIKIWTANGAGGGSWGSTANTANQANALGSLVIKDQPGANEFIACNKDNKNPPRVICYRSTQTPAWSNPANQILTANSDTGIQISFGANFEDGDGLEAIAVYSDGTAVPSLKKYIATTQTWDAAATPLPAVGAALETARVIPQSKTNDVMLLLANTNQDVYSAVWNGDTNAVYTSPGGYVFAAHGVSGSADENFWYDFAWDQF